MNVRPIRTDADYRSALDRMESLMAIDAPDQDREDEIQLLALVIEDYERRTTPIAPPDPIEAVKFRMDQMGLTAADVAPYFGGRTRVYEVLKGRRDLNASMMRALNEHLGVPGEVLLGRSAARLPESPDYDWRRFPVREMTKLGWVAGAGNAPDEGKRIVEGFLAGALGTVSAAAMPSFRLGSRENAKADPYALTAWCCQAMRLAAEDDPPPKAFHPSNVDPAGFLEEIAWLSRDREGPRLAVARMREEGIRFVVLEHLRKTYLDGAAMSGLDGAPLVALTLRYDRLDYFWFCLMHELAHVVLHLDDEECQGRCVFIDDMSLRDNAGRSEATREHEADSLAEQALIDREIWDRFGFPEAATELRIAELAMEANVHPSVVAGRVRFQTRNYRRFGGLIGNREIRRFFPRAGVYPQAGG